MIHPFLNTVFTLASHAFTFIINILKLPLILRDAYSSLPGCSPLNSLQEHRAFYIVAIFYRMSSVELLNFGTVFINVIKISMLGPSLSVSVLVHEAVDRKTLLNRSPSAPNAAVSPWVGCAHSVSGGPPTPTQQGVGHMRACGDAMLAFGRKTPHSVPMELLLLHPWSSC